MIDLEAIYTGVGEALRGVPGLRVADLAAELPPPPVCVVLPPSFDLSTDASVGWCWVVATLPVALVVGRPTERVGRVNLAEWLPQAIDALEKDSTFGGVVGDSNVVTAYPTPEDNLPGYTISVRLFVPR